MSCAGLNFIILKINDIDVTNLTHDETVEIFLKLNDPIIIKVRRRRPEDSHNKLSLFDDDDWARTLKYHQTRNSVECQTDFSISCIKNTTEHSTDSNVSNNAQLCQGMIDTQSIFAHCFAPEIDIEEVTLQKSCSDEKLGLTVSYSSANGSTSISASDDDDPDSDNVTDNDEENDGDDDNNENSCGDIYICDILPGSIAARDGRLRQGDQIIQINGKQISSKDETESIFAEHKNSITLLVSRCVYTDDEFLDSAIYCDDKDQNTGISISLDCEPSTYSSKSSLRSFAEAYKQQIPLQAITAIDTNTCDHANIRAQLESVNKEISLLNSQISHMKLQKGSSQQSPIPPPALEQTAAVTTQALESLSQTEKISSISPITQKGYKRVDSASNSRRVMTVVSADQSLHNQSPGSLVDTMNVTNGVRHPFKPPMTEVEHIYETIPEDSETYSYYCSPYDERKGQSWIEQWLKSQDIVDSSYLVDSGNTPQPPPATGPQSSIMISSTTTTTAAKRDFYLNQSVLSRIHKNNSSGDDYENSSSAYNTGDSCTSNALTFEIKAEDKNQSSSSTLVFRPYTDQFESLDNCKQCQLRCKKEKASSKSGRKSLTQMGLPGEKTNENTTTMNRMQPLLLQAQHQTQTRSLSCKTSTNMARPTKVQNKLFRKAVAQNQQCVRDIAPSVVSDRNNCGNAKIGQHKQLSQPSAIASLDASSHENETTTMAWKVKRRTDGTRYIVRRPVRRSSSASSCHGQRNSKQQHFIQHQQDLHKDRQINDHEEIISSTSSGVVVKDEIITITEASNPSSGHRYSSSLMASNRMHDSRKTRSNSERTKQRRQTLQIKQTGCQQSSPGVSQLTSTCTRSTSRRHIQTQWVI